MAFSFFERWQRIDRHMSPVDYPINKPPIAPIARSIAATTAWPIRHSVPSGSYPPARRGRAFHFLECFKIGALHTAKANRVVMVCEVFNGIKHGRAPIDDEFRPSGYVAEPGPHAVRAVSACSGTPTRHAIGEMAAAIL
jgi:hypothetical protein